MIWSSPALQFGQWCMSMSKTKRAQLGVGGQHAMKTDQVQPRPRHQRGQPLNELQRAHDQVRGPISPRCLELELHLAPHRRVQAEAVDVGAQRLARRGLARHCASQGEQPGCRIRGGRRILR